MNQTENKKKVMSGRMGGKIVENPINQRWSHYLVTAKHCHARMCTGIVTYFEFQEFSKYRLYRCVDFKHLQFLKINSVGQQNVFKEQL